MRPQFRKELTCSREEQQGVVFFRVDDPQTETSFRLYEIEYLIAQKLDGERSLADVVRAVKDEHNFDISEADLERFVGQLDSMGFLVRGTHQPAAETDATLHEGPTNITDPLHAAADEPAAETPRAAALPELDLTVPDEANRSELERLLRSALLHVKQGYIVHARDYFLAAQELAPRDERLRKVVNHLEIIGDSSGPAEVEYLWEQAKELLPEIANEVGPMVDNRSATPGAPRRDTLHIETEEDLKTRIVWTLLLLLTLVGGIAGIVWAVREARLFESAVPVTIAPLEAMRLPVFFEHAASEVRAAREQKLRFAEPGIVAEVLVQTGARVVEGDLLARLTLLPLQEKALVEQRTTVKKAEANYDRLIKLLAKLVAEREAIEAQRASANDKLKELQPKQLLSQGGISKRDLEKWKRVLVQANRKLTMLSKRERGPKTQVELAKRKLADEQRKLETMQEAVKTKFLRAPFAGVVVAVGFNAKSPADDGTTITLRDQADALLAFRVPAAGAPQPGGEAHVSVQRGAPAKAKVADVAKDGADTVVRVTLADPGGVYLTMPPGEFRLVREFVDPAFRVPATAVGTGASGKSVVYVASQGHAAAREVEVLERDPGVVVIRDLSRSLRNGQQLIVAHRQLGDVSSLSDNAAVAVETR